MTWNEQFLALFDRCLAAYKSGNEDFETYYHKVDLEFLQCIGYKPREFFDFIEDYGDQEIPSPSTALLIAAVRRDYLQVHPETAQPQKELLTGDSAPSHGEELDGVPYLPRIIAKARAKLRGELDPGLMFSCGGDRHFLSTHGEIHPADFLRRVWAAHEDVNAILEWVKEQS